MLMTPKPNAFAKSIRQYVLTVFSKKRKHSLDLKHEEKTCLPMRASTSIPFTLSSLSPSNNLQSNILNIV